LATRGMISTIMATSVACLAAGCANHAPAFFPIGNKSVETGATLEFVIEAVDDDGDGLEFGVQGKPAAAVFEQIDDNSARFSWTPIASDAGPDGNGMQYNVVFLATDGIDTASEAITIFVTLGGAGTGAPVFITPSDYTLDLDRKQTVAFNVEVRDTDSPNVDLHVVESIPGSNFQTSAGSKLASFEWTPTEQQVAERPLWSLRVGASDHLNPEVFQDITILIKGGHHKCEGTPPTLQHDALPDQRGSGDYPVTVTASDKESRVTAVALYWMIDTGSGESFTKSSLSDGGSGDWSGSIPNPGLKQDETAKVIYYICATDDDDASGSECDLRGCIPEDGRFTFTAYAQGSSQCQDDPFEGSSGNDDSNSASKVEFDQNGGSVLEDLKICPGNVDWYQIQIPAAGYWLGVLLGYTQANGQLRMDLYDQDGVTLLAAGQAQTDEIVVYSDVFQAPKSVYLRIEGAAAAVENRYSMYLVIEEYVPCNADTFEPNNDPNEAKTVTEDVYTGLTCCGEPDWYAISLNKGDKLEVEIEFTQADGDLDLWIFDHDTAYNAETLSCDNALGCSTSETDNEQALVESIPATGTYYIGIGPYQGAKNSYDMLVTVTPQAQECTEDGNEPNDDPDHAVEASVTVPIENMMLCTNNEDWYDAYLFQGEKMIIDLTFSHAAGDLDLKLYDPDVTEDALFEHQLATSLSSDDNEHIEYDIPADGFYYMRVYGYDLQIGNTYTLLVSYQ